jgi:hypothetical protein
MLVVVMMVVLALLHPRRRNLFHLHPWFGLPLASVPLLLWGWAAYREDPTYILFLLQWYVLRRMGGTVFGQSGPPGYHFALMFVLLLPWSGLLVPAVWRTARGVWRRRRRMVLLAAWLAGGWLVWELPPSKLPTYALGGYPAMALLLAAQTRLWCRVVPRRARRGRGWTRASRRGAEGAEQSCVRPPCPTDGCEPGGRPSDMESGGAGEISSDTEIGRDANKGGSTEAASDTEVRRYKSTRRVRLVRRLLIGAPLVNLVLWLTLVPAIEPWRAATKRVAEVVRAECGPEATLVMVRPLPYPSLPFYALQNGLHFEDIPGRPAATTQLVVDWGLLWRLRLRALAASIEAQSPKRIGGEEARRLRVERTIERYASGERAAYVLDEGLWREMRDRLPGARAIPVLGWRSDAFRFVDFVVVVRGMQSDAR